MLDAVVELFLKTQLQSTVSMMEAGHEISAEHLLDFLYLCLSYLLFGLVSWLLLHLDFALTVIFVYCVHLLSAFLLELFDKLSTCIAEDAE